MVLNKNWVLPLQHVRFFSSFHFAEARHVVSVDSTKVSSGKNTFPPLEHENLPEILYFRELVNTVKKGVMLISQSKNINVVYRFCCTLIT